MRECGSDGVEQLMQAGFKEWEDMFQGSLIKSWRTSYGLFNLIALPCDNNKFMIAIRRHASGENPVQPIGTAKSAYDVINLFNIIIGF